MTSEHPQDQPSTPERERAERLHREAVVFNALDCTPWPFGDRAYMERVHASGTTAMNHAMSITEGPAPALQAMVQWKRAYQEFDAYAVHGERAADIAAAKATGRTAFFFGFEDTVQLDGRLALLEAFYALGLRFLGLTYQHRNQVADGCAEDADAGLSRFGRAVVDECNRLGIVLDLSHTAPRSSMETYRRSKHPTMITHAALRHFVDDPRNKPDDEIRALADYGGVVSIAAKSGFLLPQGQIRGATMDDYVNHIEYAAELVGIDHVGVGTDIADDRKYTPETMREAHRRYPEIPFISDDLNIAAMHPHGLASPRDLYSVTTALVRRGFSDDDIKKVLGGNAVRLMETVIG